MDDNELQLFLDMMNAIKLLKPYLLSEFFTNDELCFLNNIFDRIEQFENEEVF